MDKCHIHGIDNKTEDCWIVKKEAKKFKYKSSVLPPDKETVMAMVEDATKKFIDQNYHPKRMKQVNFPTEELNNFEKLSIEDSENDQRPDDVFSETDNDL